MKLQKVLLVDDDSISNHVNKRVIEKSKFADEIIVKTEANEALSYVLEECYNEEAFPELILLDLKMPGMDGFDFLEAFEKGCAQLKRNMVVVILTSSRNGDDIIRLRSLGNYYLLNKPLNTDKLSDIYHRYFRSTSMSR